MLPPAHRRALKLLVIRLQPVDVIWALTGSTSFVLQGIPLVPADVDVQTDERGAYAIQEVFRDQVLHPVGFSATEAVRSHFGELVIEGVRVELMGALQKRLPDGAWEPPVEVARFLRFVDFDGLSVPVLALEYEYRAYLQLGRAETAEVIREFLDREGKH